MTIKLSLALLAAVWRTGRLAPDILGAGRALKVGLRGASVLAVADDAWLSFFILSSLAAFNFAATASPGNWKVDFVTDFVDFWAGGGVGKERATGPGFE